MQVYANVFGIGSTLLRDIYSVLKISDINDNPTESENLVALNTLGWPRKEVLTTNGKDFIANGTGTLIAAQGFTPTESKPLVTVQEVSEGIFVLENSHFTVTVESGTITSLLDRRAANREVLAPGSGRANQLVIFDDKPIYWQAWDVEVFHLETREEVRGGRTSVLEASPLRASVVTETRISEVSSVRTVISLAAVVDESAGAGVGVECTAEVDWHETMKFLKVEFPVDVRHHEASYDTQFGVIRRPTHYNTS